MTDLSAYQPYNRVQVTYTAGKFLQRIEWAVLIAWLVVFAVGFSCGTLAFALIARCIQ